MASHWLSHDSLVGWGVAGGGGSSVAGGVEYRLPSGGALTGCPPFWPPSSIFNEVSFIQFHTFKWFVHSLVHR